MSVKRTPRYSEGVLHRYGAPFPARIALLWRRRLARYHVSCSLLPWTLPCESGGSIPCSTTIRTALRGVSCAIWDRAPTTPPSNPMGREHRGPNGRHLLLPEEPDVRGPRREHVLRRRPHRRPRRRNRRCPGRTPHTAPPLSHSSKSASTPPTPRCARVPRRWATGSPRPSKRKATATTVGNGAGLAASRDHDVD